MFNGTMLVNSASREEINRSLLDLLNKINDKKNLLDTVTQDIVRTIYPIGSIFFSTNEYKENKVQLWEGTTWVKAGTLSIGEITATAWRRVDDKA